MKDHLEANLGEYRPMGAKWIRITAEGCVMLQDMDRLLHGKPIKRDVLLVSEQQRRTKTFTRLMLKGQALLADRITGTIYHEASGRSSSANLRLA